MKNILNINERISYLVENKANNNKKKFAEMIGFAPQVVSNIVSGRKSKPSFDVLNAIKASFVDVNSEWLLTGEGEMLKEDKPYYPSHLVGKPDSKLEKELHKTAPKHVKDKDFSETNIKPDLFIASLQDHINTLKTNNLYLINRISFLEAQLTQCNCEKSIKNIKN